jgi:hypothetical protein
MHVTRQGILLVCLSAACVCAAQSLPGTAPLEGTNALADAYMSGLDRFMLRATDRTAETRDAIWRARLAAPGPEAEAWIATNRQILARLLGVRAGSAALCVVRHYFGRGDRLLLVTQSHYSADRYSYRIRLRFDPQRAEPAARG